MDSHDLLRPALAGLDCKRLTVAFSAGMDSAVLLHLAMVALAARRRRQRDDGEPHRILAVLIALNKIGITAGLINTNLLGRPLSHRVSVTESKKCVFLFHICWRAVPLPRQHARQAGRHGLAADHHDGNGLRPCGWISNGTSPSSTAPAKATSDTFERKQRRIRLDLARPDHAFPADGQPGVEVQPRILRLAAGAEDEAARDPRRRSIHCTRSRNNAWSG